MILNIRGKSIGARWVMAIVGVLVCIVILGYYIFPSEPDIPPASAISKALNNTVRAQKYEYKIEMSTFIDGKQQQASSVRGMKETLNRIHIKGRIFESDIDFYQIDDTTYTKDQLTGEWVKLTDNQLNQQEIFMGELNPLASFSYKELHDAKFEGANKIDGDTFWVYSAEPVLDNPYMEILWRDFRYKFWLEQRSFLVRRAEITAVSKNNPDDKMNLNVEFFNYNGNIEIKPPQ